MPGYLILRYLQKYWIFSFDRCVQQRQGLLNSDIAVGEQNSQQEGQYEHSKLLQQQIMRAIHIARYGRLPVLTNCPLPQRNNQELLIKMKYAPINPSDLFFYLGLYGIKKEGFPIMGFEGSGIIKEAQNDFLVGRKVSVLANKTNGTYAEFIVSKQSQVIVWPNQTDLSLEEMSMFSINPLSVLGMADIVRNSKAETVILSAAASNTSKMLMRLLRKQGKVKSILGISRSSQHDEALKNAGYNELYRSEDLDTIKKQLKNHDKTVFLDCVGGSFAGHVFNLLPPSSQMVNYGRLSKQDLGGINLGELYYRSKTIRGFWLNNYLGEVGESRVQQLKDEIINNSQIFKQNIRQVYPLDHFEEATRQSIKNQSQGKILLRVCSQSA